MGRVVKRVALDFDWPLKKDWPGYKNPFFCATDKEGTDWYEQRAYFDKTIVEMPDYEPPVGDGYQLWETISVGSPVSPVFETLEQLSNWMVSDGYARWAVDDIINGGTWLPSAYVWLSKGIVKGIKD